MDFDIQRFYKLFIQEFIWNNLKLFDNECKIISSEVKESPIDLYADIFSDLNFFKKVLVPNSYIDAEFFPGSTKFIDLVL